MTTHPIPRPEMNAPALSADVAEESLARVRSGGKQTVVVRHQHVHVSDGGGAVVAGDIRSN